MGESPEKRTMNDYQSGAPRRLSQLDMFSLHRHWTAYLEGPLDIS
ncbi:hypothetical protein ACCD10_18675 [Pseudomonas sp. Pseusp122]